MEEENLFDGKHYITAQVIIPADDFAKEMLGEDPDPYEIARFINDHASLMSVLFGSARIARSNEVQTNPIDLLHEIAERVRETQYYAETVFEKQLFEAVTEDVSAPKKPWYKRLFCK